MQANRPPASVPSARNPYYSANPNPAYHQYSESNFPPYYPQPRIHNPTLLPQQSYSTGGFNSLIRPPGAHLNPAISAHPYIDSSNLYNAPQLGLAHAYSQAVPSAPASVMSAASAPSLAAPSGPSAMTAAPAPSAMAAAVAAVMSAYCQEFNSPQMTLNPYRNGVTIQQNVSETLVTANPKPSLFTQGVTIQPNVAETFVPPNPKPALPEKVERVKKTGLLKKAQKQVEVLQPGWCEVCKIDCSNKTVPEDHILGKKHKKNLEKLAARTAARNTTENPDKSTTTNEKRAKRKAAANVDVETKKKKMVEGGVVAEAVRMCHVCKVVCNSETVLNHHLQGFKHAAMMRKLASKNTIAT